MKTTHGLVMLLGSSLLIPDHAGAQSYPARPGLRAPPSSLPGGFLRRGLRRLQTAPFPSSDQTQQKNRAPANTGSFKHHFLANVKVAVANGNMVVQSNGLPNHETGTFPNADNPNYILPQTHQWTIPTNPVIANRPSDTPMGPIGIAINGVPFYNYKNAQGYDAVTGPNAEVFDSCCGHPDNRGTYHYHKMPTCIKSPFREQPGQHSPIIGYAFDGFPIYGLQDESGKAPANLDECNGHFGPTPEFPKGIYHYHCTNTFPYTFSKYRGVVNLGNRGGGRGRKPSIGHPPRGLPGGDGSRPARVIPPRKPPRR